MHSGTSAGKPAGGIGDHLALDNYDPQQFGAGAPEPTADAGAHWTADRVTGRCRVYPARTASPTAHPSEASEVSGWMSIRAPVSRAASRAFCPSRPIASESW